MRHNETEKATDIEYVMFLIKHLENPCENLDKNNLRDFYLREAQKALPTIQDEDAKKLLEQAIQKYSV